MEHPTDPFYYIEGTACTGKSSLVRLLNSTLPFASPCADYAAACELIPTIVDKHDNILKELTYQLFYHATIHNTTSLPRSYGEAALYTRYIDRSWVSASIYHIIHRQLDGADLAHTQALFECFVSHIHVLSAYCPRFKRMIQRTAVILEIDCDANRTRLSERPQHSFDIELFPRFVEVQNYWFEKMAIKLHMPVIFTRYKFQSSSLDLPAMQTDIRLLLPTHESH